MKYFKSIPFLLALLMLGLVSFGQDSKSQEEADGKLQKAIGQTLAMLKEAETADQWQKAANTFDRIAKVESDKWIVHYYKAYTNTILSFMTEDKQLVDQMLDEVDATLVTANQLSPDNSEVHVMMALAKSARIQVDPMGRGMTYGPQSTQLLNKAMELDENNPRAYYLLGQNLVYTPEAFGGGKEAGCNMLTKSKEKFATFEISNPIMPDWGEEQVDQVIAATCNSAPEKAAEEAPAMEGDK